MKNKPLFLKESKVALEKIFTEINELKDVNINSLEAKKTAFIIIDMNNDFA